MACPGLGVVIDAAVFVFWFKHDDDHIELMKTIKREGFYIVLCEELKQEYLENLYERSAGKNYWLLKDKLDELKEDIAIEYPTSIPETSLQIHEDDQHVLNCALNTDYEVHLIITDNEEHFKPNNEEYRLPLLISTQKFFDPSELHTFCSEARRIREEIPRNSAR
ncbi:hypothetical protein ES708_34431 [subsurface metagenome]